MTQEELDALMSGDIDLEEGYEEEDLPEQQVSTLHSHPPFFAAEDNTMTHQSDNASAEEPAASTLSDLIEGIGHDLGKSEEQITAIHGIVKGNIELFESLCAKFPHIEAFKTHLSQNKEASTALEGTLEMLQNGGDAIANVTDMIRYQDDRNQKIEHSAHAMHALSAYMNRLLSGHLPEDTTTDNVVGSDAIEAFLASFPHTRE